MSKKKRTKTTKNNKNQKEIGTCFVEAPIEISMGGMKKKRLRSTVTCGMKLLLVFLLFALWKTFSLTIMSGLLVIWSLDIDGIIKRIMRQVNGTSGS